MVDDCLDFGIALYYRRDLLAVYDPSASKADQITYTSQPIPNPRSEACQKLSD